MLNRISLASALFVLAFNFSTASAQLYWDANGANPGGSDTNTAAGTWGADSFWNTDPDGNAAPGAWVADETAVFSAGSNVTGTYDVTLNGTQSASGIQFKDGTVSITGGIELTLTGAAAVNVNNGLTATIDSVIGGTAGLNLSGTGTLVLTGANTYSGNTFLADNTVTSTTNTLRLGASEVVPDTSVVQIEGKNSVFDLNGNTETVKSIASINTGSGALQNSRIEVGTGTLIINDDLNEVELYQANLFSQSSGKIKKVGAGQLNINSSNSAWDGEFVLSGGLLGIGAGNILGTNGGSNATAKLTLDGGTITFFGTGSRSLQTENIDITNSFDALIGASNIELLGFASGGEGFAVTTLKVDDPTITVSNTTGTSGVFILRGPIGDEGQNRGFTKAGAGVLTLGNPNNTFTGGVTVQEGYLNVDGNGTVGDGTGTIHMSGGHFSVSQAGHTNAITNALDITAAGSTIRTTAAGANPVLEFSSPTIGGTGSLRITNDASGCGTPLANNMCVFDVTFSAAGLNFGLPLEIANGALHGANLSAARFTSGNASGTQTYSNVISGTGRFRRSVAGGTTTLTAANTYSGGTEVEAGSLLVSGASATLGAGNVTITGGDLTISSGVSNAIADTATLSLLGGGTPGIADIGFLSLGTGINEHVAALLLNNVAQANGTYGSTASSAMFKFNEFFSGAGIVSVGPAGVPGDYNGNGVVDAADYVLWRNGGPLQNEVDTPGTVNAADYTEWRARFGNTSGSGSSLGSTSTVPEPGAIAMLVFAIGSLLVGGGGFLRCRES